MSSKLARARDRRQLYVSIEKNIGGRLWNDFHLCEGHIYGYSPELNGTGLFVLYDCRCDSIVLRVAIKTPDRYVWQMVMLPNTSDTARRIMTVRASRRGSVVVDRYAHDYKPQVVTGQFTPMPNMRIPMGNRGIKKTVETRKRHNVNIIHGDDPVEKLMEAYF